MPPAHRSTFQDPRSGTLERNSALVPCPRGLRSPFWQNKPNRQNCNTGGALPRSRRSRGFSPMRLSPTPCSCRGQAHARFSNRHRGRADRVDALTEWRFRAPRSPPTSLRKRARGSAYLRQQRFEFLRIDPVRFHHSPHDRVGQHVLERWFAITPMHSIPLADQLMRPLSQTQYCCCIIPALLLRYSAASRIGSSSWSNGAARSPLRPCASSVSSLRTRNQSE